MPNPLPHKTRVYESEEREEPTSNPKPNLKLFVNNDDQSIAEHRLARCVYAETLASSLPAVEALCVMARNTGRPIGEIADDEDVFESLNPDSARHEYLLVKYDNPGFQMCLRTVKKINSIQDKIMGVTRFHRDDMLPEWAVSMGSVAEIDGLLFYKG